MFTCELYDENQCTCEDWNYFRCPRLQMCAPDHVTVMTSNSALLDEFLRLQGAQMVHVLCTTKLLKN